MKISLHVPASADLDTIRKFVRAEIAEARNIKLKQTRKSVMAGLGKVLACVDRGVSIYTDGVELIVESYTGI